jgi:hypothetical protein
MRVTSFAEGLISFCLVGVWQRPVGNKAQMVEESGIANITHILLGGVKQRFFAANAQVNALGSVINKQSIIFVIILTETC